MINFISILSLILLLLGVEINSEGIFFRGRYFDDDSETLELRVGTSVQEKLYSQTLDHFKPNDTKMWNQRYHVNEAFYGKSANSPIFLKFGGEGRISTSEMTAGFKVERAKDHRALLFQLEHRFYGRSHPTANTSAENLSYLTVEQVLEDAASFIVSMKKTYNLQETNKWIVFGGSYNGNLAAWLRFKYPHLVYGAISSSGPVESVVDFKDYFRVVAASLGTYSQSCVRTMSEAFASIDQLSQDANGKQTLTKKFNLCTALEKSRMFEHDFAQLNNGLANSIVGTVQYNNVYRSSNKTIDNICKILANGTLGSTSLDRFAVLIKILTYSKTAHCFPSSYQNFVNYFKNTDWKHSANNGARQWFFQTCNQMGYFQSSSSRPHVFGNKFPVEHMIKQCTNVFGPQYTAKFIHQRINKTNKDYLGKGIVNHVDRVVFVQGSIDPWHPAGVLSSSNPKSPAIFINGTAHCADMLSNSAQDLPQLRTARKTIGDHIRNWLL